MSKTYLNPAQKAQMASIVSSTITLIASVRGIDASKHDQDLRHEIAEGILHLIEVTDPDPTSWEYVRKKYKYDVYLEMRTEDHTLTELDMTRPNLTAADFSDGKSWHEHCMRVSTNRGVEGPEEMKLCSVCDEEKPRSKFKKNGGTICSACQSKAQRQRKKDETPTV